MSSDVDTLMEMGFPKNRVEKAIFKTQHKGVQQAMDWLFAHSEDPDIDDPFEAPPGNVLGENVAQSATQGDGEQSKEGGEASGSTAQQEVARSLKCDDCGKLLKSAEHAELHAARSGHSNFSESTEEIKPLTEEQKKEQLARIQERIKEKRAEKEELEKNERIQQEKLRRVTGKEMSEARQKQQEDEIKKMVQERKREKEAEKKARDRVKAQIEKDKLDRAVKFGKTSPQAAGPSAVSPPQPTSPPPKPQEKKEYDQTRIQVRMANGQSITQTFGTKEPLSAVRLYTQMNRTDGTEPFTFMTTFPRKVYTESDMDAPLNSLDLVPSAVLIVTKPPQ